MAIWTPQVKPRGGPLYRRIADALAEDIVAGRLPPKSRLPTQRELAEGLRVTVTTVTRAYAAAARRGLISGEIGRGTFVRASGDEEAASHEPQTIDLSVNALFPYPFTAELAEGLATAVGRVARGRLFDDQPNAGTSHHRAVGAEWISRRGLAAPPEHVLVTAGAQHAMTVVFLTITRPGDLVLTEEVTYAGMLSLAQRLGLRVRGVAIDSEGLRADALRTACRSGNPKALFLASSLQTPTGAVLSDRRRKEIAAVARKHDLAIVEDDCFGFLLDEKRPLACIAPERTYYIATTSKVIAPSVRIGFLLAPGAVVDELAGAICATVMSANPIIADLACAWLADGTVDRIVQWKREEIAARQEIARRALRGLLFTSHSASPQGWLRLGRPWRAARFVAEARMRNVLVRAADDFAVKPHTAPAAVRICLWPPRTREALERGLQVIAEIASQSQPRYRSVV